MYSYDSLSEKCDYVSISCGACLGVELQAPKRREVTTMNKRFFLILTVGISLCLFLHNRLSEDDFLRMVKFLQQILTVGSI